jgi:hypothetical protein
MMRPEIKACSIIGLLILSLGLILLGCEEKDPNAPKPKPPKATIEVQLEQTLDAVTVVVIYRNPSHTNMEYPVTLKTREELDAYQEQVRFLSEKLTEAQNEWEKKAPLPALHVEPESSSAQLAESEEDYEFDESVWGPGPSEDMWAPPEEDDDIWAPKEKVTWFEGNR